MKTAMSWYHLGLRGRLFIAFGVVAALTVLASSSAMISYDGLGRSLGAIADKSLPEITRASEVVRAAGEVAAAAPRLLAATDEAEREHALKVLTAARQELTQSIGALAAEDAARLNKTADRILVNLDRLTQSVTERQTIGGLPGRACRQPPEIAPEARRKISANGRRRRVHLDNRPADGGGQ